MTKKFDAPVESRDVESYRQEARAMITKWGPMWMIRDEDSITNVATAIARAEHDFDPERGCKRVTLRCTYGRRQIWAEARRRNKWAKRPSHWSIDTMFNEDDESKSKGLSDSLQDYRETEIDFKERIEELKIITKKVRKLISSNGLTQLQKKYLRLHYITGVSVSEIANRNCCSKQAVHQVLMGGIMKIKTRVLAKNENSIQH
jgi:RNA polymerase sigma factor (sigma-70 family)